MQQARQGARVAERSPLWNRKVLLVEDETLVAMMIEEVLEDLGCSILGPCMNLADALRAARDENFDIAVLDVNLRGERVYPVAEMLSARGIPFVLLSGYGKEAVPKAHPDWRVCSKPFHASDLTQALENAVAA